jgi:hypothetical protein
LKFFSVQSRTFCTLFLRKKLRFELAKNRKSLKSFRIGSERLSQEELQEFHKEYRNILEK